MNLYNEKSDIENMNKYINFSDNITIDKLISSIGSSCMMDLSLANKFKKQLEAKGYILSGYQTGTIDFLNKNFSSSYVCVYRTIK